MSFDILSIADIIEPSAGVAPGFIGIDVLGTGGVCCAPTGMTAAIERVETMATRLEENFMVDSDYL